MALKIVVVHACRHAEMDDGSDFDCSCAKHVTMRNANELVAAGVAFFKRAPLGAVDNRQILLTGRMTQLPRATTITSAKWWENLEHGGAVQLRGHIERAYVEGNAHERERIEIYGAMQRRVWLTIGAPTGKVHHGKPSNITVP